MNEHFFIIGAQRSGTTYLYSLLDSHPEIEMARPLRPEPKFFLDDSRFDQGVVVYERAYFRQKPGARLLGEKSTSYMEHEKAARRIAAIFPAAKIIALLRDPVERAISNYYFSVENGLETLNMDQAFRREAERATQATTASVSPFAYLARGRYADYLEVYERFFPREQLIILLTEQFTGSLEAYRSLCERLGVSNDYVPPELHSRFNETGLPHAVPSPNLAKYLYDYYEPANMRLAARYDLDLRCWPSFAPAGE